MTMSEFEEICKLLKDRGYRPVSMEGPTKRVFIDDNSKISVTIEIDNDMLTAEDEKLIEERLIELGYL